MTVVPIRIPKYGLTVEEVTLIAWTVQEGARVAKGDVIAVVETDKIEVELEAPATGTMLQHADPGGVFDVGDDIGAIAADGDL